MKLSLIFWSLAFHFDLQVPKWWCFSTDSLRYGTHGATRWFVLPTQDSGPSHPTTEDTGYPIRHLCRKRPCLLTLSATFSQSWISSKLPRYCCFYGFTLDPHPIVENFNCSTITCSNINYCFPKVLFCDLNNPKKPRGSLGIFETTKGILKNLMVIIDNQETKSWFLKQKDWVIISLKPQGLNYYFDVNEVCVSLIPCKVWVQTSFL